MTRWTSLAPCEQFSSTGSLASTTQPHSGLRRNFRAEIARNLVGLFPMVLPTGGPIDHPLPDYSRNPFVVRSVGVVREGREDDTLSGRDGVPNHPLGTLQGRLRMARLELSEEISRVYSG